MINAAYTAAVRLPCEAKKHNKLEGITSFFISRPAILSISFDGNLPIVTPRAVDNGAVCQQLSNSNVNTNVINNVNMCPIRHVDVRRVSECFAPSTLN